MKKIATLFLLTFLLVSCGGVKKTITNNDTQTSARSDTGEIQTDAHLSQTGSTPLALSATSDDYGAEDIIAKKDTKLCASILDSSQKVYCVNQIYYNLAVESKNYKYCAQIRGSNMKNKCKSVLNEYFASNKNCKNIEDSDVRSSCMLNEYISNNQPVTKQFCNSIVSVDERMRCGDYNAYSIVLKDPNIVTTTNCDSIENSIDKNNCYQIINARNVKMLEKKQDTSTVLVSGEKKDIQAEAKCSKIVDNSTKGTCLKKVYSQIAVEKKDITYCDVLSSSSLKDECRNYFNGIKDLESFKTAKSKKDAAYCANISDSLAKKQCITIIGSLK